jgi:hypothetical protein
MRSKCMQIAFKFALAPLCTHTFHTHFVPCNTQGSGCVNCVLRAMSGSLRSVEWLSSTTHVIVFHHFTGRSGIPSHTTVICTSVVH